MKYKAYLVMFVLAVSIASSETRPVNKKNVHKETVGEWICQILHIDPKAYARLLGVRGGQEQIGGSRIALADLKARTESVIFECKPCWSPAAIDSENIAVLKVDGIWVKPLHAGSERLAVPATGLRILVGNAVDNKLQFVVLQHREVDKSCENALKIADLSTGSLDAVAPAQCLAELQIEEVRRAGALRGNHLLVNNPSGAGVRRLLQQEFPDGGSISQAPRTPLLPWIDAQEDGIDRFDAVWLDDNRVVYLQN
jgi:hypothetical protein